MFECGKGIITKKSRENLIEIQQTPATTWPTFHIAPNVNKKLEEMAVEPTLKTLHEDIRNLTQYVEVLQDTLQTLKADNIEINHKIQTLEL